MHSLIEISAFNCCMRSGTRTGNILVISSSLVNCHVRRLVSDELLFKALFLLSLSSLENALSRCVTGLMMRYQRLSLISVESDFSVYTSSMLIFLFIISFNLWFYFTNFGSNVCTCV